MAVKARKRLIAWLAVLASLCLVTSLVLVLFLWGRPEHSAFPEPIDSTEATLTAGPTETSADSGSPTSTAVPTESSADSGGFAALPRPFDSATPPSETSGGETDGGQTSPPAKASGETISATDIALAGAAIASAFGGLCTGIAAVMVARRTPRQGPPGP
ncbi:hypothetical protein GCM10010278_65400 [Streptomyces melanogenes]|nr:hypothetical protein GCM10010278_65400 [Streptomyces melanogenes]